MRQPAILAARALFLIGLAAGTAHAQIFVSTLSGAAESPPNASTATGRTTVTLNTTARTLRVQADFNGLSTGTTAAHIHCCVSPIAVPNTVGVASQTPSFAGFPLGVMTGNFDNTFNLTSAASYNPAFIAANGGTVAGAEAALVAGIRAGQSYLNIHTTMFPGGEIRGFLALQAVSIPVPTLAQGMLGVLGLLLVAGAWFGWRRRSA